MRLECNYKIEVSRIKTERELSQYKQKYDLEVLRVEQEILKGEQAVFKKEHEMCGKMQLLIKEHHKELLKKEVELTKLKDLLKKIK
jgi:hypothetical protein